MSRLIYRQRKTHTKENTYFSFLFMKRNLERFKDYFIPGCLYSNITKATFWKDNNSWAENYISHTILKVADNGSCITFSPGASILVLETPELQQIETQGVFNKQYNICCKILVNESQWMMIFGGNVDTLDLNNFFKRIEIELSDDNERKK